MNIGIIGAGNIGGTLGTLWVQAGHQILFGTRHPENVLALSARLRSKAGSPADAAKFGDVVVFAAPYGAWPDFARSNAAVLANKVVIDAANPYGTRDGAIARQVARSGLGAGGYTATLLPKSRVAKAFNSVIWLDLRDNAHRGGDPLAIAVAGDDPGALRTVALLARDAGFEAVVVGGLCRSAILDPGGPAYARSVTAQGLKRILGLLGSQAGPLRTST
jgi:8-hydroxy-5-deazaflavin:NADPH oxidoreductase